LTDEVLDLIVRETNRYADQFTTENAENLKQFSNVHNWKETTRDEIRTYLGIVLLMGIVYKPRYGMYWSLDNIIETPIFGQVMTRNRFLLLTKFLHFANNDDYDAADPERDRLFKIRDVVNLFRRQWKTVYTPGKNLCVDESLVLFKGRLAFKQYIRTKRSRFGVKFYTLCTSHGYTLDTMIYSGNMEGDLQDIDGFLTTEKIPLTLMADYLDAGRVLYLDNFYTTPKLAKHLLDNNTYTVGTVRTNRKKFPRELARADIEKGTSMFFTCNDVLAVKFRAHKNKSDGKPKVVHVLTTKNRNTVGPTKKKDANGDFIKKPTCVLDYNKEMGGVDKVDQQLHQLHVLRKSYKWYKKIFLRILLQSSLNAHKLYRLSGEGNQDFLGFLKNTITIMFSSAPKLHKAPRNVAHDDLIRLTGHDHFAMRRLLPEGSQRDKAKFMYKVCKVCKKGQTPWVCKGCPDLPGLHMEHCFEIYHTERDYSRYSK
jgi:hypothetical protein